MIQDKEPSMLWYLWCLLKMYGKKSLLVATGAFWKDRYWKYGWLVRLVVANFQQMTVEPWIRVIPCTLRQRPLRPRTGIWDLWHPPRLCHRLPPGILITRYPTVNLEWSVYSLKAMHASYNYYMQVYYYKLSATPVVYYVHSCTVIFVVGCFALYA